MNTVNSTGKKIPATYCLEEVCPLSHSGVLGIVPDEDETAFIGTCGDGPEHALYLIGYKTILLAKKPRMQWDNPRCPVQVDRFVDLEIKIREKE